MVELIRYEPYLGKYIFSHLGDLYAVDGPVESDPDTALIIRKEHPENGLSVPTRVQIQATNRCNFRCQHCYAASGGCQTDELTNEQIRRFLSECQQNGVLQIEWSGGEPFVRKGFMGLMAYAQSLGFEQSLLTNGFAIGKNPRLAAQVLTMADAVQISICGYGDRYDAWTGRKAWNIVLNGISALVTCKPETARITAATTLDRSNSGDLEKIGATLAELNVDSWILARQVRNGRSNISETEADRLLFSSYEALQKMRRFGNHLPKTVLHPFDKSDQDGDEVGFPPEWITEPAARTFMYVSSRGYAYPFPYYDGEQEWLAGNILSSNIDDLWTSAPFKKMREATRALTGCGDCRKICQLWSRWFNYGRNRNVLEPPIVHPTCTRRTG